jgi:hypothetical protein
MTDREGIPTMRKDTTPPHMLFDRRVVERNIRKGVVSRDEYNDWLAKLGDAAPNSELIQATLGSDDDDDLDDDDLD